MISQWQTFSESLGASVNLINAAEPQKFQLILNRIANELIKNPDSKKPFSDEEEEKLLVSLSLSREELHSFLTSSILIFDQIIYNIVKPNQLVPILTEVLKLNEEKANAYLNTWTSNAKQLVSRIKEKPVNPCQLEGVSWLVNIETSTEARRELFVPKALLQLKVQQPAGESLVSLDLTEQSLYQFYEAIEDIQSRLDNLL